MVPVVVFPLVIGSSAKTASGSNRGYLRSVEWPAPSAMDTWTNGTMRTRSRSPALTMVEISMRRLSRTRGVAWVTKTRPALRLSLSADGAAMALAIMISGGVASCSRPS